MSRRRGFTLIELLVVVAVLGVLMSILLPSLRSAKRQVRRTVCATNLRQLGVAMQGYTSQNQDRFPRASFFPSSGPFPLDRDEPLYIADVLAPYVGGNEKVFECPEDRPERVDRPAPNISLSYFQSERSSYEYRVRLAGRTIEEVANRVERFMTSGPVADNAIWIMRDFHNFHRSEKRISRENEEFDDTDTPGTSGQRNYLFSDGHVSDYETF